MTTNDLDDTLELPLTLRVPRRTLVVVAAPPATVTQKTAETHFGIPEAAFKTMVKEGLFPAKRIGRLLFAAYDDVRRALTEGAKQRARFTHSIPASKSESRPQPMAIEEAGRYLEGAPTPAEYRRRRDEVHAVARDHLARFDETKEDGTPNPNFDKELRDHAMSLYYRVTVADVSRRAARAPRRSK